MKYALFAVPVALAVGIAISVAAGHQLAQFFLILFK